MLYLQKDSCQLGVIDSIVLWDWVLFSLNMLDFRNVALGHCFVYQDALQFHQELYLNLFLKRVRLGGCLDFVLSYYRYHARKYSLYLHC